MTPIIVVKGKEEAQVFHEVDLQGWIDAGWKVKGEKSEKATKGDESKSEGGE